MQQGEEIGSESDYNYCAARLKDLDRDRYLVALAAGGVTGRHLLSLYAFNLELLQIPEVVSEAHLGRIRIQWWRDSLDLIYEEDRIRSHQVVRPLAAAIAERQLSRDLFAQLLDAREEDLSARRPEDLPDLLTKLERSLGALASLTLEVLDARDASSEEAARRAAVAYGLQGLVKSLPGSGGGMGWFVPQSFLTAKGLRPEDLSDPARRADVVELCAELCGKAREIIIETRKSFGRPPRNAMPALQFASLAAIGLRDLEKARWDPFQPQAHRFDSARIWRILLGKLLRSY